MLRVTTLRRSGARGRHGIPRTFLVDDADVAGTRRNESADIEARSSPCRKALRDRPDPRARTPSSKRRRTRRASSSFHGQLHSAPSSKRLGVHPPPYFGGG